MNAARVGPPPQDAFQELYELGDPIGQGGFGIVFAGTRRQDGRPVAVKFVAVENIQHWGETRGGDRVPLEVCLLDAVSGIPGVIELLDCFVQPDSTFMIVMERVDPS